MISLNPFSYLMHILRAPGQSGKRAISGTGYEATETGRLHRQIGLIVGISASPDRHLAGTALGRLRELCRAHDRQSSLISGMLDRAVQNVVGSGFDFIPATGDRGLDDLARDYIGRRMEAPRFDAAQIHNMSSALGVLLRAGWNDGDCLWVRRKEGSVQFFEADQIESPTGGDAVVVMGVRLDEQNRHLGYFVRSRPRGYSYSMNDSEYTELTSQYAHLIGYRKRFGQTRGVPYLASALSFASRFHNYLDFESLAAEANAMAAWKITRDAGIEDDMTVAPDGVETNDDTNSLFTKLQKMEPMMIFDLPPGQDMNMVRPDRPGDTFDPYVVTCCRIIGVAVGLPLELVMLDFSKTNYSSARASLGEARRNFRWWQHWLNDGFCMPWHRWQIARGIALGELPADGRLYWTRCQWPAWEYVDPYKEAMANKIAIETRTKTVSQCIRESGNDPEEVFDEMKNDQDRLRDRGLLASATAAEQAQTGADDV